MFQRKFTSSSPNLAGQGFDGSTEMSGKEPTRPPLFPLQDTTWNSGLPENNNRSDLLTTPRSVVKWLSSTPLPDPFFESQENFGVSSPDKHPSNVKSKILPKDNRSRVPGFDGEPTCTSSKTSASSVILQETHSRIPHSDHKNLHATPQSVQDSENGSVIDTPVARSLKYTQSAAATSSSTSLVPTTPSASSNAFELEDDPNFWKEHNVQVVIRIRPLSSTELASQGHSKCVRQESANTITWVGHPESRFTFDIVASEAITQEKIFKVAGQPMVDNCLSGYNSCMFAYGQTGSGKTFTMLGDLEGADHRPSKNRGMTPRVFEYLFAKIEQEEESRRDERLRFICKCSFLEIYNEQILDLLDPTTTNLQMREDAKRGVYVENLSEVEVTNVHDVIRLLLQGAANRKVAATNMNRESSRSHSVFTCTIESKWTSQSISSGRFGRLNLVDLAGSERQKTSGAEGERLKEAANINKSLSTLGLVIMSLVDIANGKQRHVPYRDSKLTFLLHDSLGGNSKTTIIANISPSNCNALETLSTLKFAQRAKFIRNNAVVNENAAGDVIALRLQITQLKQEVSRLRMLTLGGNGAVELAAEGSIAADGSCLELSNASSMGHSAYSLEAWDSFRAFSSPVISNKKKDSIEIALIGSLRREQAGEARIRQLQSEIEQFKRLVKQREEDSQCSKMMLRFREDKIKRLESALSGKIPIDNYLLEEKNALLEEVQILRTRLERNPEVTRFAMENIRLLEDLRRFQDFYEAGEREVMVEEISILRDQLLEALDWKLMHEQDSKISKEPALQPESAEDKSFNEMDKTNLEKQIETVGAVASMQAELIAMHEAVAASAKREMEAREKLAGEIEGYQRMLKELEDIRKEYEDKCSILSIKCESLESEKNALIMELEKYSRSSVNQNSSDMHELEAAVEQCSNSFDLQCLQNKLTELQVENQRLHSVLEENNAEVQQLRSTMLSSQEELDKIQITYGIQAFDNSEHKLQRELDNMHSTLKELEQQNRCLEEEVQQLRMTSTKAETSDSYLHLNSKDLQEENNSLRQHIACLEDSLKQLQLDSTALLTMYESVASEKDALMNELHRKEECSGYRQEHSFEELQNTIKELQMENSRLCELYQSVLNEKQAEVEKCSDINNLNIDSLSLHQEQWLTEWSYRAERRIEELVSALNRFDSYTNNFITLMENECKNICSRVCELDQVSLDSLDIYNAYNAPNIAIPEKLESNLLKIQSNLNLMELKFAEHSSLVDGKILKLKESISSMFLEFTEKEKEVTLLENSWNVAQEKQKLQHNKKSALTKLLCVLSSSKVEWASRQTIMQDRVDKLSSILAEKENEITELQIKDENLKMSLDQLLKQEEMLVLESEALEEKLKVAEIDASNPSTCHNPHSALSMLQLLRGEEEKATLLSVIAEGQEKLGKVRGEIDDLRVCIDQTEEALRSAQSEWEAKISDLKESEAELQELKRERQALSESDSEARSDYEDCFVRCSQSDSEVVGLEHQALQCKRDLKTKQDKFSEALLSSSLLELLDMETVKEEQVNFTDMLAESRRILMELKCMVGGSASMDNRPL
uniref:Kinesin 12-Ia protein n=1 Tax=Marsilea vestita TaxID=59764 RepID=A0A142KWB5_MARVE|nr:kinesin 12-Ia protein [Marsilea vestita]